VDIAAAEGLDAGSRKESEASGGGGSEPRGSSPEAGTSDVERHPEEERPRRGFPFLQVAEVGSKLADSKQHNQQQGRRCCLR
jgi:hypothetical protein